MPKDRAAIHMLNDLGLDFLTDLGLDDIWRLINPTGREYTFYSHSHKSYSRIDMFLISNTIIKQVVKCKINAMALSDHAPVELGIDINTDQEKKGRWPMNTSLLQDENFKQLLKEDIKSFFEINAGSTNTRAMEWEASKAYDKLYQDICKLKFQLQEIYNKKVEYALFRLGTTFYEGGEKTGKLLARQLKKQDSYNVIPAIQKGNSTVSSTKEINDVLQQYYKELYTSDINPIPEEITDFLTNLNMPKL